MVEYAWASRPDPKTHFLFVPRTRPYAIPWNRGVWPRSGRLLSRSTTCSRLVTTTCRLATSAAQLQQTEERKRRSSLTLEPALNTKNDFGNGDCVRCGYLAGKLAIQPAKRAWRREIGAWKSTTPWQNLRRFNVRTYYLQCRIVYNAHCLIAYNSHELG